MIRTALLFLLLGLFAILLFIRPGREKTNSPEAGVPHEQSSGGKSLRRGKAVRDAAELSDSAASTGVTSPEAGTNTAKISIHEADLYLQRFGTNVDTLLASHQLSDAKYLEMAAKLFPEDPRVQFLVVSLNLFPAEQKEWVERLKKSDPENAYANLLSASRLLEEGDKENALKEFLSGVGKKKLKDYAVESAQANEEMLLALGRSPGEAKLDGSAQVLLPALKPVREVANAMNDLSEQYLKAGEKEAAFALVQANLELSRRFSDQETPGSLIHQLVGFAMERKILGSLEPETHYDFLNGTPSARLAELKREREYLRDLVKSYPEPGTDDAEMASFVDRMKLFGEKAALEWLRRKRQGAP